MLASLSWMTSLQYDLVKKVKCSDCKISQIPPTPTRNLGKKDNSILEKTCAIINTLKVTAIYLCSFKISDSRP